MENQALYSINTEKIVFENFEDETVLINLENGNYYGIMNVGKVILNLLENGIEYKNLLDNIAKVYQKEAHEIEADILSFWELLVSEGIIIVCDKKKNEITAIDVNSEYSKPILEKYTDMQDLILLDPVHDVSEKGWPHTKENEDNSNS